MVSLKIILPLLYMISATSARPGVMVHHGSVLAQVNRACPGKTQPNRCLCQQGPDFEIFGPFNDEQKLIDCDISECICTQLDNNLQPIRWQPPMVDVMQTEVVYRHIMDHLKAICPGQTEPVSCDCHMNNVGPISPPFNDWNVMYSCVLKSCTCADSSVVLPPFMNN